MAEILASATEAMLIILALGVSYIAFTLRATFAGGYFERAWLVIGMSPIVYAVSQGFDLWQTVYGYGALPESIEGAIQVVFLITLLYGFYSFASAWNPEKMKAKAGGA